MSKMALLENPKLTLVKKIFVTMHFEKITCECFTLPVHFNKEVRGSLQNAYHPLNAFFTGNFKTEKHSE